MRTAAGLFDVSHMGEIETRGPRAAEFLRHLLTNDIAKVAPGGAQYSLLCREDGGVLDDLFTYRLAPDGEEERFLTVVNASNADIGLRLVPPPGRRLGRGRGDRPLGRLRDARAPGPAALEVLSGGARGGRRPGALPPRRGRRSRACPRSCAAPATPARTASSCCSSRRAPTAVWDALLEARRAPGRARRARHPAARGLLPAVRQRPHHRAHADRGGAEVGLRARQGLRRRRAAARAGRAGHGREAGAVRVHRARASRARAARCCQRRRAGGVGDKRYPLALHGGRDRDGLRLAPTWPSRAPI